MRIRALVPSVALAFATLNSAKAQEALTKPIAQIAINYHLATRLAGECNSDVSVDTGRANKALRGVLAKEEGMSVSTHGFGSLIARIGPELLFAAENVYFEQMGVSLFDRRSFCNAAQNAIEDNQVVGQFLKLNENCRTTGAGTLYCD